ncbi:hypothetical protein [Fusibacter ferrireducens]|uniref:Uncharacterized protein n=1 Tax=Fusibacter ferrireducens TaxID=2785058 RepID=A0ABR9ZVM9_9FIRM|nr:hypothetical protein [Fusibacter ferrireducens]MBF4693960.1 hypothetical protein [Fusibacter ferrireducens]
MNKLECLNENIVFGDVQETIKAIKICAKEARISGLLSMDDLITNTPEAPLLFRIGAQCVIDGLEHKSIKAVLTNPVEAENLQGEELVESRVIITGLLDIQQGEHPRHIIEKCTSHLGINAYVAVVQITNWFTQLPESRIEILEDTLFGGLFTGFWND